MKLIDKQTKEWINAFTPGIILVAVIILVLSLIPNKNIYVYTIIVTLAVLIYKLIGDLRKKTQIVIGDYLVRGLQTATIVSLAYCVMWFLGGYGLIGVVVIVVLFSAWKLWCGRVIVLNGMRHVETMMFGAPLDKKKKLNVQNVQRIKKIEEKGD